MFQRIRDGVAPVTDKEFEELQEWFEENGARLHQLSLPHQSLDLGGGRTTYLTNLHWGLRQGPRALGAGRVAEDLRRLKMLYG